MLSARRNNWLAAVVVEPAHGKEPLRWGLASADVSTGEVQVMQRVDSDALHQELAQLAASELLWSEPGEMPAWCPDRLRLTPVASTPFSRPAAEASLLLHYKLASLDGLGLPELPLALRAMGGLLAYLRDTQPLDDTSTVPLESPRIIHSGDALVLDAQTRRNLELTATQRDGALQGSLLWAIDRTLTAMGGRCLRRWIEAPLMDLAAISGRQAVVSTLVEQRNLRQSLRRLLRPMGDLERLAGRAGAGHAGARDLVAIADGLERLPQLAARLDGTLSDGPTWLSDLLQPDPALQELASSIRHALVDAPPLSLSEGGLIQDGVNPLLDGLRNQLDDQDAWLSQQEQQERRLSGNSNLRLQYHRTFGYFLAVSKAKAGAVPDHWIRRQTLANEERFITPDLKQREGTIFQLRARAYQREYELFCRLREQVGAMAAPIRQAARAIAGLDALTGLADAAATGGYCAPELVEGRELSLEAARHPVVEQLLVDTQFTANDVRLGDGTDLVVLTGPNASGKSCYLRQIGLIQLLAQIGSWVPATRARIGIADRIFTRVGAVDDLAAGQSTFMVEMAETANILHHATERSLVLLDEIGRGTATFDGLSIAWAVSEHLAGDLRARTVFATHYHELNNLAGEVVELVIVGRKHGAGPQIARQVFTDGPGNREAIEGGSTAADFIQQHQGTFRGVVKDVGGFGHLHHEGGLAGGQVVDSADAGEDPIGDADASPRGWHPAADLGQQLDQADLAQITALATGVGAGEHHQISAITEPHVVGGELGVHQQLLYHRVAGCFKAELTALHQFRGAVAAGGGGIGQAGEGIQAGNGPGGLPDWGGHGSHLFPQPAEQFVLALIGPGPQLEDRALPLLEIGGDEAFFIGQGLAADPVVRHGAGLGFAHRQEVTEGAVVLQPQVAVAAQPALLLLLLAQPGVLIIQLIAQAIEQGVDAVLDQAAFGERERWRIHQGVADAAG